MRPSRDTARHLAESLDRLLSGRRVERIWRPGADLVLIDVGRALESQPKARLLIDVTPRHPRVVLTTRWPETPSAPDRETLAFRGALENQRIAGAVFDADRRLVVAIQPSGRRLVVQLAGRYPNVAVIDGDGAVMQALHADQIGRAHV